MRANRSFVVILLAVASSLFAQQTAAPAATSDNAARPGATSDDLEGREWRIAFYLSRPYSPSNSFNGVLASTDNQIYFWRAMPYIAFDEGAIKGSPGCGQFTGSYHRLGDQLTILAQWTDDKGTPCDDMERYAASTVLQDLAMVRRIDISHKYDGFGYNPYALYPYALSLRDENDRNQFILVPIRIGKDFSELHDTFWHLTRLEGSSAGLSHAAIHIDVSHITFSTPSYIYSIPFQYNLSELGFYPAIKQDANNENSNYSEDRQTANTFDDVLHKVGSYQVKHGHLTLFDKDRRPIMVLNPFRHKGIENRMWRIAKVRIGVAAQTDSEGLTDAKVPAWIVLLNDRVEGSPGCGSFLNGTYKLSGSELTLQTSNSCSGGGWSGENQTQANWVNISFKDELRIEQRHNQIILRDMNGQAQILLVPF
jgi:heat shock protein HslJ